MIGHFVSESAGDPCRCGARSTHKVGEEVPHDEPVAGPFGPGSDRHNFTAYVCCACFRAIMGPAVFCPRPSPLSYEVGSGGPVPDEDGAPQEPGR